MPDNKPNLQECFAIYRDYVKHEDYLINSRLSWNLTIQGFLFATYGLSLQKLAELLAKPMAEKSLEELAYAGIKELRILIFTLPCLGILASALVLLGVVAAARAIESLESQWKLGAHDNEQMGFARRLPDLTGGGAQGSHFLGLRAPMLIPVVVCLAWIALLCSYLHHFGNPFC